MAWLEYSSIPFLSRTIDEEESPQKACSPSHFGRNVQSGRNTSPSDPGHGQGHHSNPDDQIHTETSMVYYPYGNIEPGGIFRLHEGLKTVHGLLFRCFCSCDGITGSTRHRGHLLILLPVLSMKKQFGEYHDADKLQGNSHQGAKQKAQETVNIQWVTFRLGGVILNLRRVVQRNGCDEERLPQRVCICGIV